MKKRNFLAIAIMAISLLMPMTINADTNVSEQNDSPVSEADLKEFFEATQIKAENGDAEAQRILGSMYFYEADDEEEAEKGISWLTKAAEQNDVLAQSQLGCIYFEIVGDYEKGLKWSRKAAEQGNAIAQAEMGMVYIYGLGVETDLDEAIKWLKLSVAQDNELGQCNMGVAYDRKGDYAEAIKWYRLSAEKGQQEAQYNLGLLYESGNGFPEPDMNKAIELYTKAAEQGHADAQHRLGVYYDSIQELEKAANYFYLAAEQGHADAQYRLGLAFSIGAGVVQDSKFGMIWLDFAAKQGHEGAIDLINRIISKMMFSE